MRKQTLSAAAVVVAVMFGVTACSSDDGNAGSGTSGETNQSSVDGNSDPASDSGDEGGADGGSEVAFGETATIESGDSTYAITASGPRKADVEDPLLKGSEADIAFDIEIEALEGKAFAGSNGFAFVAPDGEEYSARSLWHNSVTNNESELSMTGPDEGQTTSGAIVFKVPADHDGYVLKFEGMPGVGADGKPTASWS